MLWWFWWRNLLFLLVAHVRKKLYIFQRSESTRYMNANLSRGIRGVDHGEAGSAILLFNVLSGWCVPFFLFVFVFPWARQNRYVFFTTLILKVQRRSDVWVEHDDVMNHRLSLRLIVVLCASVVFVCHRFGISRQEQDEFALRSHQNAAKAHADGIYEDEVCAVGCCCCVAAAAAADHRHHVHHIHYHACDTRI